ncbi:hypothetical protein L207DRAFT_583082 [Hyaloscypha variabilis F]|uniref:Uncharacterized protein n=1 Tax=Hyaloscypha variabilis (strain UAMH 11265 / GT02V1 / F) TaxID=1149755 RepID=A0A2J6RQW9_HYAVF|nr:hypothetical protein L207DRAFT_583082 [Hyaloscypha variabilis F]
MSGIEIVAGVAAVVTAFNGSVKLYQGWKEKRKERLERKENQNLERSLTIGGETVQKEYDGHFAKLGPEFAVGDDRGRAELAGYVIKLQHTIITLITESNGSNALVLPSLPKIYSTSEDTRKGVVSALAQQYQRMVQARPLMGTRTLSGAYLSRVLSDSWQSITSGSSSSSLPLFRICTEFDLSYHTIYRERRWVCACGFVADCWGHEAGWAGLLWVTPFGERSDCKVAIEHQSLCQYHFRPNDRNPRRRAEHLVYCLLCYDPSLGEADVERYTREQMQAHLEDKHTLSELRDKNLVYYVLSEES